MIFQNRKWSARFVLTTRPPWRPSNHATATFSSPTSPVSAPWWSTGSPVLSTKIDPPTIPWVRFFSHNFWPFRISLLENLSRIKFPTKYYTTNLLWLIETAPYNNNRAKVLSRNPIYQDNSRYTGRPLNMAQNAEQSNAPYAAVPRPRYNGPAVPPPPQGSLHNLFHAVFVAFWSGFPVRHRFRCFSPKICRKKRQPWANFSTIDIWTWFIQNARKIWL